jgi:hypothetical protein
MTEQRPLMKVRVISFRGQGIHTYGVTVLAFDGPKRSWGKNYPSRQTCLDELGSSGLLTATQIAEAQDGVLNNFKARGVVVFHTETTPEMLIAAGLEERTMNA